MHGIQGTWASSWLQVDLLRVKQPSSRVPSAASIDVASNWLLGNRDHSLEGVEAWQSAKGTATFAVLLAAIAVTVAQSPQAPGALLLGLTGRIWIATLNSNRDRLWQLLMHVWLDF